jgi:hypothetical protein
MKKNALYLACFCVFIQACKKDKAEETKIGPYTLSAPSCLITNSKTVTDGTVSNSIYAYDSQRRLISTTEEDGTNTVTYAYQGDHIIESRFLRAPDGTAIRTVSTHYLNAGGFIIKTIEGDSTQTLYTYNGESYLTREVKVNLDGQKGSGISYQYSNGNRITSYNLHFDSQTGNQTDSALGTTYSYYDGFPAKMGSWESWTERLGRPNKNEVKQEQDGTFNTTYDYKIGSGGVPSSMTLTYMFGTTNLELTWNCN